MQGKKTASIFMTVVCLLSCCAGCGRSGNSKTSQLDASKSQLNIGIVDGGLSYTWLDNIIARFEAQYADVSFEEGKTGVQVRVFPEEKYKANSTGFDLNLPGYEADVIFTEGSDYLSLQSKDLLLDITDVVTQSMQTDFVTGETNTEMENSTIESKLTQEYVDYYKTDGHYYGLPYYISQSGIVYDVDMFESELFYFARDGRGDADGFVEEGYSGDDLAAGPDGKYGTRDDGLPATYDDFFDLCDRIAYTYGYYPIAWAGKVQSYATGLMYGLWADYEGKDAMRLNFDFSGTASDLIDPNTLTETGFSLQEPTEIGISNGYELYAQAGRYYAIDFMKRLLSDSNYYDANICISASTSHLKAQDEFLYSTFNYQGNSSTKTPIAMLIEGTWWENEADKTFSAMVDKAKDEKWSKYNRRFAFMPFPKATEDKVGEVNTTLGSETLVFVNAAVKNKDYKVKLAKAFIQYSHTESALADFAVATNSVRPFRHTLTETQLSQMTYFGRSLYEDWNTSEQVFAASQSSLYKYSPSAFSPLAANGFSTAETNTPSQWFFDHKNYSSAQFFKDVISYNGKSRWDSLYSSLY